MDGSETAAPAKRGLGVFLDALDTREVADAGVEVEIVAPDGTGTGFYLTLLGQDSAAYQAVQERNRRRLWSEATKRAALAPKIDEQIERSDELTMELLVACTKGWRTADGGPVVLHGAELAFNEGNVRRLYDEGSPIIKEQAQRAILDRANFIKRSA